MKIFNLILCIFSFLEFQYSSAQTECDNCINKQIKGSKISCTKLCNNQETTEETDCLDYTRCLYNYDLHKVHNICICQKVVCNYKYVCPHSEIIHYGDNSIEGYTVYELSLELKNINSNIYAIYGDKLNHMIIPSAYQLKQHQGADIGGINPILSKYIPDTKYDSWLTIGLTDGNPIGKVDSIGIDYDSWTENNNLVVTNGAIFLDNPLEKISKTQKYIIAHLTLKDSNHNEMIINVNGKKNINGILDNNFNEQNIIFDFPKKI
jgi:hypothetical protein